MLISPKVSFLSQVLNLPPTVLSPLLGHRRDFIYVHNGMLLFTVAASEAV